MRRNSRLTAIAGFVLAAILLAAGGLLLWGSTYMHNMVQGQLAAQQIYFPPKAAFAHPKAGTEITPSMIPSVSQYAGQQLVTGQQAESYADNFIAVHIANMAGGKTYAQLSAASLAQPNNTKLAGQVATVFKGETLRSHAAERVRLVEGLPDHLHRRAVVAFGLGGLTLLASLFGAHPGPPPRDHPRDHRRQAPGRHDRMTPVDNHNHSTTGHLRPAPATDAGRRRPGNENQ